MKNLKKGIRQILFKNKKVKRQIALFMVLCMIFSVIQMPGLVYSVKAETSAPTVTTVTLDGKKLEDGMTVYNGSVLKINFNWAIDDLDKSTKSFSVDLSPLQNIVIAPTDKMPLVDDGVVIGYYQVVSGNKLEIVIESDEYLDRDDRHGGVEIEGVVRPDDAGKKDDDPIEIKFYNKSYNLVYNTGVDETTMSVNKSAAGDVYKEDGVFKQDFNVYISPSTDVTGISVAESYGTGLEAPVGIKISASNCAGIPSPQDFASFDALNAYLADKEIKAWQGITLSYTQEVDHTSSDIDNTATVTFTSNKGNVLTKSGTAKAAVKDPTIAKSGVLNGDSIDWTITVDLRDYASGISNISDVVDYLKDTPGAGLLLDGQEIQIDFTNPTSVSGSVYTYTYSTQVENTYLNTSSGATITNDAELKLKDGTTVSTTGSVKIDPKHWVEKEFVSYDDVNKIITWDVYLDVPDGVTDVTLSDVPMSPYENNYGNGNHSVTTWDVYVDNVLAVTELPNQYGQLCGGITPAGQERVSSVNAWNKARDIVLNNTYVAQKQAMHQKIKVTFQTEVSDDSLQGKAYNNTILVNYKDPEFGQKETSAYGQFKDNSNLLKKSGEAVNGQNAVQYRVQMYLYGMDMVDGKVLRIEESFPGGLVYRDGSVKAVVENEWRNSVLDCGAVTYDEGTQTFSVQVTQDMINKLSAEYPYVTFYYTMDVENEGTFTMNGGGTYTNNAEGYYATTLIGSGSSEVTLKPQQIVNKTGNYSLDTAPYATYEVYINEDKLDLLPGDGTLTAKDTLGSALSYKLDEIKIEKREGSAWVDIPEARFTYDGDGNSLIFTKLPDQTWIRISYKARVNLAYGDWMTPENSTNTFALEGASGGATEDGTSFSVMALKPSGWAASGQGKIELYKYWTDDGQMKALEGAEFELRRVKYDAETNQMVPDSGEEGDVDYNGGSNIVKKDITVSENGVVTVSGLSYARIYALYETKAPGEEYAQRTEPYYFVLTGTTATLPPEDSGIKVNVYASGSRLPYENYKNTMGSLTVTKRLDGVDAGDVQAVLGNIQFEIKSGGATIAGGSFSGSDMAYSGGIYKKTFSNLSAGVYTVTETVTDTEGYIYKTSAYEITVDGVAQGETDYTSGSDVSHTISAEDVTVAFTNEYEKTASLRLKKTVTGDVSWDDVKDNIVFIVYADAGLTDEVAVVNGSDMAAEGTSYVKILEGLDPSKTYYVVESGADVADHTRTTTYTIGGAAASNGETTGAVSLTSGETETVAFINDYKVHKGKIKLTKVFSHETKQGETPKTWDEVASSLSFTVTNAGSGEIVATVAGNLLTDGDSDGTYEYLIPEDLPVGTYIVTENAIDISDVVLVTTYKVTAEAGGVQQASAEGKIANAEVLKDDTTTVAYDNKYTSKYATLVIRKSVSGDRSWSEIKDHINFTVTRPNSSDQVINGGDTGWVKDGENVYQYAIEEIIVPGLFTVKESFDLEDTANYTRVTTVKVDNGAAQNANEVSFDFLVPQGATVQFDNNYTHNTGDIVLEKTISGVAERDLATAKDTITFTVTPSPTGDGADKTYKLSDFTKGSDGKYTLTIKDVPTGSYHVKETVCDIAGYDTESVEYTISSGLVPGGKVNGANITVEKDAAAKVAVADTYEIQKGSIELTKSVQGDRTWEQVKDKISFRVTNIETGYDETFREDKFTLSGGVYVCVIPDLPLGEDKVTEMLEDAVGYTATTTYTVGSGSAQTGKEADVDISAKGQVSHVAYVNEYDTLTGSILLKKSVTGDASWTQVRDTLSFVLMKNGTTLETIRATQFTGPDSDGNYYYTISGVADGTYTVKEVVDGENNVTYKRTTTVKVDAGQAASGLQGQIVFDADDGATVTVENNYKRNKGSLMLKKTLAGIRTEDITAARNQIAFTVTPSPTGNGGSATYKLSEFVKDGSGNYVLSLAGVPTGTYTVKETAYDVDGYDTESVEYLVTTAAGVNQTPANGKANGATVAVGTGALTTVAVTDEYEKQITKLVITKTIRGDVTEEEAKGALQFKVTNNGTGTSQTYTLKDHFIYDAVSGKYILELDVTAGGYTVEETVYDVDGYVLTSVKNTVGMSTENDKDVDVTVLQGQTVTVDYENTYASNVGDLKLIKTVAGGATFADIRAELSFVIEGPNGYRQTFTGDDMADDGTLTIHDLPVGDYTITETAGDVLGYVYVSATNTEGGTTAATIAVPFNATAEITFNNTYSQVETGKLVITKKLEGDVTKEEAEGALRFKVTNNDTGDFKIYTLDDDFVYDDATGIYTMELPANVGGYTVEESVYDVDGYIITGLQYSVDGGALTDVDLANEKPEVNVNVTDGGIVTVNFKDAYEKKIGNLVLAKTVKGDLGWGDVKDKLSFVVKNNKTGAETTYQAASFKDDDGDGVYTLLIEDLPLGSYTVTEKLDDANGYTVKTTCSVDGKNASAGTEAKFELVKTGNRIDFVNEYTDTKGELVITKKLRGNIDRKDAEAVIRFKVTNTKTGKGKTYTLDDFEYDKSTEKYSLKLTLEPGAYKVTETAYDVDGYKTVSVTYTVGDGNKTKGTSAKVKVKTAEKVKVAFVDKYSKTETSGESTTSTSTSSSSTSSTTTTDRNTPKTGDDFPLALWIMLLMSGALGLGVSVYGIRKNSK